MVSLDLWTNLIKRNEVHLPDVNLFVLN